MSIPPGFGSSPMRGIPASQFPAANSSFCAWGAVPDIPEFETRQAAGV